MNILNIKEVEVAIGKPTDKWKGNCYEIACEILDSGLIKGRPAYGHYYGKVASTPMFSPTRPWQRHGWIVLPDGKILDPTRWVFEDVKPYIWYGEPTKEYDEGGNEWKRENLQPCPQPNTAKPCPLLLTGLANEIVTDLTGVNPKDLTMPAVFWLANLPYDTLETEAWNIYQAISKAGLKAFIPIDNWLKATYEEEVEKVKI